MIHEFMHLKILLPYGYFLDRNKVKRIVIDTREGLFGIWPNRLDCTTALVPGIFTYETMQEGEVYLALDEGVIVKTGAEVVVSVRNAIGGTDLGKLQEAVKREFLELDEKEKDLQSVLTKLESGFIRQLRKLRQE